MDLEASNITEYISPHFRVAGGLHTPYVPVVAEHIANHLNYAAMSTSSYQSTTYSLRSQLSPEVLHKIIAALRGVLEKLLQHRRAFRGLVPGEVRTRSTSYH